MALWVSLLDWNGQSNPLTDFDFVGLDNYQRLLTNDSLLREDFAIAVRNTLYYVLAFVPAVASLAFGLALIVNNRRLKGRGFFRTVFYFPSITSSVAISVTFLFLFQSTGVINTILGWIGIDGPTWFNDARGVLHIVLDGVGLVDPQSPPGWLADPNILGLSLWQWVAGPSVAMCALLFLAVWTSSGTFMLFFLAGLQNIPLEVDEASAVDGASKWQRFRYVTLPLMRPSIALVATLALIGSWQVFDQVFIISQGAPGKTTQTPAYLSYTKSFGDGQFGQGASVAFVLFAIIIVLTGIQRWISRERK
ncbi:MAG: sugar ABC transporter permease [Acidimicrobiia bacterium]|nr:sugar ABC transporter permease [Acidimicrobiia bacterium]